MKTTTLTAEQIARVESERPIDGLPIPARNALVLAAYSQPGGSVFVTLVDDSEETWEAYCKELASSHYNLKTATGKTHANHNGAPLCGAPLKRNRNASGWLQTAKPVDCQHCLHP